MKQFIKGWWHVTSAVAAGLWLVGAAVFGWVGEVNASMRETLEIHENYVRKDVLNETMLRIEAELRQLNENFKRHNQESKQHNQESDHE
jgi:hypothetical protein